MQIILFNVYFKYFIYLKQGLVMVTSGAHAPEI